MGIRNFDVMSLGKAGLIKPDQLGYQDSIEIIKDESYRIQKSFVKIGWYLKHLRDNELYKEGNYSSIWECAADQLGYSQSTASRFINICEKFSKNHNSPELDEKYAGFDKSQMIEMLPLDQEQLERVTPDMTVKQIRDVKAKGNEPEDRQEQASEDDIPGQTSIEKDFPEYMPKAQEQTDPEEIMPAPYATSHKEAGSDAEVEEEEAGVIADQEKVIDGNYKEIGEPKNAVTEEAPDPKCVNQLLLPVLKNNDQRKDWLSRYKEWGLWYRDEKIDVNYYKYDFTDGSRLIVTEYPQRYEYWNDKRSDEHYYHLLEKSKKGYKGKAYDEQYRQQTDSETYLIDFLKNLQKMKG